MKLYLLSQDVNNDYDTYDSAVVAAETETEAQKIEVGTTNDFPTWAKPKDVKVEYLGEAQEGTEAGVVLASFNAG
jgi:hypothetical protein